MQNLISKLLIYGDLEEDSILYQLGEIYQDYKDGFNKDNLTKRIYKEIKKLLILSTNYGFDENLWQNYLTYLLITNENPFSITCEKIGANKGSVNTFALNDFMIFRALFNFDFKEIEDALSINCFTTICNYKAITKKELMYNKNVSNHVRQLSKQLSLTNNENEFFDAITAFYKDYGVGMFGLNKAFRFDQNVDFIPINNMDAVVLDDLIGYDIQKKKLIDNTYAFVNGKPANNVLLYGDSGTGKSTSIKAIVNEFYKDGLRMIEIYKHQFKDLSNVISQLKNRNYRFIIYMDDLSFEENETEYKFLKAVIEGGVETKPENILIYATSNRRHLIKENWNDRNDMEHINDIHRSETMEEKLSLVNRFGVTILYSKPSQNEFMDIVVGLANNYNINMSNEELKKEAHKWELSHGGLSGRTAQQFINYILGK